MRITKQWGTAGIGAIIVESNRDQLKYHEKGDAVCSIRARGCWNYSLSDPTSSVRGIPISRISGGRLPRYERICEICSASFPVLWADGKEQNYVIHWMNQF